MVRRHENAETNHAAEGDEKLPVQLEEGDSVKAPPSELSAKMSALFDQANALRSEAAERVYALEHELEEARTELEKVDRLLGRDDLKASSRTSRNLAASSTKSARAPRGAWLGRITEVLQGKADGLKKSELVSALGAEDDNRQIANISSALQQGKKNGSIGHRDGRYYSP